jgi:magnesium transporter
MDLDPSAEDFHDQWVQLTPENKREVFSNMTRLDAEELFLRSTPHEQVELLNEMSPTEKRSWLRLLPLDDAADYIQHLPHEDRMLALTLLDEKSRNEVLGLLAYAEDDAGGLMNPHFIRLRPSMSVEEAIRYIRSQAKTPVENIYYAYVLENNQKLVGVVSFRELLLALPDRTVEAIMHRDVVTVPENMDREEVALIFSKSDIMSIPVIDDEGHIKGIVTYDDIVTVARKEATEDIQKIGGVEALDLPYSKTSFLEMVRKRAGWLTVLFLGEMLTATAMGHFQKEIERAVVLALFIPLIISSGGNSGSQATTLIIRALALQEIKLRDWWRVFLRELGSGLALGGILGLIGLIRILVWQSWNPIYGDHYFLIGMTVSISLLGVVMWGTLAGSMLPFILRALGFDPASASAPFVATLVDVTGLIIYFTVASLILGGTLL